MNEKSSSSAVERRHLTSIARKYRRNGYAVVIPDKATEVPRFLGDHVPDLIATSETDRVVIEIKRAGALQGANDIVDLAERIEREPDWRFELVALANGERTLPEMSREAADAIKDEVRSLVRARFHKAAFLSALAGTESLIESIAARNDINAAKLVFWRLVRTLATEGLVSAETYHAINKVMETRNQIVHGGRDAQVEAPDIDAVLAINDELLNELLPELAA